MIKGIKESSRTLFNLVLLGSSVAFLTACPVSEEASSGEDLTAETGDEVEDIAEADTSVFSVSVASPVGSRFVTYATINGDHSTTCEAGAGEDVTCIIDIEELDLFFNGLTIRNTVPSDQCYYRDFMPYFYLTAPLGTPPGCMYYKVDGDGNISSFRLGVDANDCDGDNDITTAPAVDNVNVFQNWGLVNADLATYGLGNYTNVLEEDEATCPFDYSAGPSETGDGENCCWGTYYKIVDNTDDDEEDSQELVDWGGQVSNCNRGAGKDSQSVSSPSGFIRPTLTIIPDEVGFAEDYEITAPISKDVQLQVHAANYFAATDHAGNFPNTLMDYDPTDPTVAAHLAFPYFRFDCLDENAEVTSRINVLVREWNVQDQLTSNGNPDTTGAESAPFPDESLNDYSDWKDFGEAFLFFP